LPKRSKLFRFNSELYSRFKDLVSKSPYTVTGAFEKFMGLCVEEGVLSFPSSVTAEGDVEAEARVMLAWLKKGKHWYSPESGEEEFSVEGRLLQLLPRVRDQALKEKIEESVKAA
jgi:hypothetical protein